MYVYLHIHTCMYIYTHLYTYTYMYIHMYIGLYICIHLYTCIYMYVYTRIYSSIVEAGHMTGSWHVVSSTELAILVQNNGSILTECISATCFQSLLK